MATEGTKFQLNYKLNDGTLINLYAATVAELESGLADLAMNATNIRTTGIELNGGIAVAPPTNGSAVIPTTQIFFNENMWNLFASFETKRISNQYLSSLTDGIKYPTPYYIPIYDTGDNSYTPPTNICESALPPYFIMRQDYNTTGTLWSPVSSIVFCSTLPVFNESSATPQLFDNDSGQGGYIASSNAPFTPSITDGKVSSMLWTDCR